MVVSTLTRKRICQEFFFKFNKYIMKPWQLQKNFSVHLYSKHFLFSFEPIIRHKMKIAMCGYSHWMTCTFSQVSRQSK
jgi:hypothetical protein